MCVWECVCARVCVCVRESARAIAQLILFSIATFPSPDENNPNVCMCSEILWSLSLFSQVCFLLFSFFGFGKGQGCYWRVQCYPYSPAPSLSILSPSMTSGSGGEGLIGCLGFSKAKRKESGHATGVCALARVRTHVRIYVRARARVWLNWKGNRKNAVDCTYVCMVFCTYLHL